MLYLRFCLEEFERNRLGLWLVGGWLWLLFVVPQAFLRVFISVPLLRDSS
ncbi:MAG: hypothetical protein HC934_10665 [Acaryochloridaceae cyanobacterium SU_2_1]|nr:hypothetical protein [Acaryochloridaceae cyanobacterium SU_2_1]